MKKINNPKLKEEYIESYGINEIFSNDMSEYMELILFKKGEYICKEDENIDYLFFFVKGKAKVYMSLRNGKSLLICFYYPFMMLGDLELVNYAKASSNTEVIEDTYCIALPLKKVRNKLLNDSRFLRHVCNSLVDKLVQSSKNGSINLLYPLENRLASYIMATKEEVDSNHGKTFEFNENLTEIAELLGTSYRHLLRTLNNLVAKGIIQKHGHSYEVIQESALKELAIDLYK